MKVYKITDKDGFTRKGGEGETKWGENSTHEATGEGKRLCSSDVIHCYKSPYLAVFMNPSHGAYDNGTMLLWEAEGEIVADDGTKSGCKKLTTTKQIPISELTIEQRVEIAIRCAMNVYKDDKFHKWAMNWILNKDRSGVAASAAESAAASAAWAAANTAWAAESAAANTAWAAANTAWAAASVAASAASAAASVAASAASAAANTAWVAASVAASAASAARAAERAGFDLIAIIHEVVDYDV